MPRVEVVPIDRGRWAVQYEDDNTPISTHETQAQAEAEARTHAEAFGDGVVLVRGRDGFIAKTEILDPDERVGP
jgi:hypothetical protein